MDMTTIQLGDGTLTILPDGTDHLPLALFTPRPTASDLALPPEATAVEIPVNAFLYRTADRCVLIDGGGAGLAPGWANCTSCCNTTALRPGRWTPSFAPICTRITWAGFCAMAPPPFPTPR